ncbi:MAG TPA: RNA methyltransferase [Byssovorax sp.]|jgi:hypothetical protein
MRLAVALVHHPVLDREGQVVTTAVTNLDVHDFARSARTYGVTDVFVVHPIAAQRELVTRIRDHWTQGSGKKRIPDRADALELVRIVPSLDDAYAALGGRDHVEAWTTAASARGGPLSSFAEARARLAGEGTALLMFGTGWGLARELVAGAAVRLAPIRARADTGWNHLSVRAACAIALDRLAGDATST